MNSEILTQLKVSKSLKIPLGVKKGLALVMTSLGSIEKQEFLNDDLYYPATHLLKKMGKLIRPGLIFTTAEMLGEPIEEYVDLAKGIELLHTASLVHDDILDKDSIRRGGEPVHLKYGVDQAILAGDSLIAHSIKLTSRYGQKVINRASEAAMAMCAGEMLDIKAQKSGEAQNDLALYTRIAELKTATLMGISTSIVADYKESGARDTLYDIGMSIGLSFQIKDDIMNYVGINDEAEKSVLTDAKNNRPNIVTVFKNNGREDPVKTATKLNNFYLDRATELLGNLDGADAFYSYIEFLRI